MDTWELDCIPLRPYRLACLFCMLGEERCDDETRAPFESLNAQPFWAGKHAALRELLAAILSAPDTPVALPCNAGGVFAWQDPGTDEDSPEGAVYNVKRDLDVIERLDLSPGSVLPARILLYRMQKHLPTVHGVCGYDIVTADGWRGCPKAGAGFYERGREMRVDEIIPVRSDEVRAAEKVESLKVITSGGPVPVRPHMLLCGVCQYGNGIRPPFHADNLPELMRHILAHPDTPIRVARGADWAMCAPCRGRVPGTNVCVTVGGHGGLSDSLRDLNVLQLLGTQYGDVLPASELYRRIFETMPTTVAACTRTHTRPSVWWDSCADKADGYGPYVKGREALMAEGLGA